MRPFFKHDDFNFLTEMALGSVYWQAADVGEVLTTVDRIRDGKASSWVYEWAATADRLEQKAAGNVKISTSTRSQLALRMRPYGVSSPYEFFSGARDYALTDELIAQIRTPVLITDPENEQFWPGQSQELFGKLTGTGTRAIIAFTEDEGADSHREPAAAGLRGERIFDWLNEQIPGD